MLKNKKILVIGAAGLLGANLVKSLLDNNASVIAADISLNNLYKSLESVGIKSDDANCLFHKIDITNTESVKEMFSAIDGLSGAVNCSYPRNKNYGAKFFEVTHEDFNENISLNLGSAFLFMQECARYFYNNRCPFSLVNVSSVYGVIAPRFEMYENTSMTMPVEYSAIKSSLIHLSKYAVKYIGDSKFRVNLVSPGGIIDSQPDSFLEAYNKHTLGKGMLDVDDILGSIIYLLSDNSAYVNGQNIIVDDGFIL
jgi:NAD(P)-dependent dehydrogenase (short-subunit alcohol dehydrogenase family)